MTRRRYSTVLFDFDHTLLDSDASHHAAFEVTMRSIGVEPSGTVFEVYDRINQALWRQVEAGDIAPDDVKVRRFEAFLSEIGVDADPVAMGATFVRTLTERGDLYAGARELLDAIRGQVALGLVTNGIGSVQRGRLERLGIIDHFDAVAISGELGTAKPNPAIFDIVLAELGVTERSGVVMVGDSLTSDIAGATNASIDSVWYSPSGGESLAPTHTARSIDDVAQLVG